MELFSYTDILNVIIDAVEVVDSVLEDKTLSKEKIIYFQGAKAGLLALTKSLKVNGKEVN